MQSANEEVYRLLNKINEEGSESTPRGLKVRELHMHTLKLSPNFPLMDFEDRPFNFKYFMGEMAWYLLKDSNISYINNFSSFWNRIADHAGNVNSNYGKLLFGEQLQWVLDTLKADINSRQAIAFVNQPKFQYEGNKDFVCTMYLNFWVRDNKLNMKVQMRSNDIFYGLSYDAPFFAFIQQSVWHWLRKTYPDTATALETFQAGILSSSINPLLVTSNIVLFPDAPFISVVEAILRSYRLNKPSYCTEKSLWSLIS